MTKTRPSILTIYNDAGLLREYAAERYGSVLTFGGSLGVWERANFAVRTLMKLTGKTRAAIIADLKADYEAASA